MSLLFGTWVFLSHLCGEEDSHSLQWRSALFLSHLCGEEADTSVSDAEVSFLSHLCGEEVHVPPVALPTLLSKSPMR